MEVRSASMAGLLFLGRIFGWGDAGQSVHWNVSEAMPLHEQLQKPVDCGEIIGPRTPKKGGVVLVCKVREFRHAGRTLFGQEEIMRPFVLTCALRATSPFAISDRRAW